MKTLSPLPREDLSTIFTGKETKQSVLLLDVVFIGRSLGIFKICKELGKISL